MKITTFAHGSAKALALTGVASVLALAAGQASAHIGYGADLNTVAGQATANLNTTVTSNMGFIGGSQSAFLGDSHNTRARWFTLTEPQRVNFTITGTNTNGNGVLNPAFSLYKEANGAAPFASEHDGYGDLINAGNYAATSADGKAYLNSQAGFASWSPFAIANPAIDLAKAELGGGTPDRPQLGHLRRQRGLHRLQQQRPMQHLGLSVLGHQPQQQFGFLQWHPAARNLLHLHRG